MSSILKALKRVEREKLERASDSFRINSDILNSKSRNRHSLFIIVGMSAVLFTFGGSVVYLFMTQRTKTILPAIHQFQSTKATPLSISSSSPPAQLPVAPATSTDSKIQQVPISTPLVQKKVQRSLQTKLMDIPSARSIQPAGVLAQTIRETKQAPITVSVTTPSAKPVAIKVDGIAFQEGGADSIAVINGKAVSKGSIIEGANVVEIQKDRVRFSRGDEKFEVILEKSN